MDIYPPEEKTASQVREPGSVKRSLRSLVLDWVKEELDTESEVVSR